MRMRAAATATQHSSVYGWGEFYRDLMTGQVLDEGRRTGITKEAWESGPIFGKKLLVAADYFSSDTTPSYQTTGTVAWTGRGGKHENIALGGAQAGKSNLRLPVRLKKNCVITARVQIPASGMDDSVGIVVGDSYASLNYGTKLAGKTKMSIRSSRVKKPRPRCRSPPAGTQSSCRSIRRPGPSA